RFLGRLRIRCRVGCCCRLGLRGLGSFCLRRIAGWFAGRSLGPGFRFVIDFRCRLVPGPALSSLVPGAAFGFRLGFCLRLAFGLAFGFRCGLPGGFHRCLFCWLGLGSLYHPAGGWLVSGFRRCGCFWLGLALRLVGRFLCRLISRCFLLGSRTGFRRACRLADRLGLICFRLPGLRLSGLLLGGLWFCRGCRFRLGCSCFLLGGLLLLGFLLCYLRFCRLLTGCRLCSRLGRLSYRFNLGVLL